MGFSEELVKNRKAANLTQEDLAEKCNVSRQAIAKWEKGESLPDVYTIAKLADLFEITIEDLIWSKDVAIVENKVYYVRNIEETDKEAYLKLMCEHRMFGNLLKIPEIYQKVNCNDMIWDIHTKEGNHLHMVCTKEKQDVVGYIDLEEPEGASPQMAFQFYNQMGFDEYMVEIIRDFVNEINREYHAKAIQVFVNSEVERKILELLGYSGVVEEAILVLPV